MLWFFLFSNLVLLTVENCALLYPYTLYFIPSAPDWEGNVLLKVPGTYDCLKFILLEGINFQEMNQVLYVLQLLLQSPNLQELEIEVRYMFC